MREKNPYPWPRVVLCGITGSFVLSFVCLAGAFGIYASNLFGLEVAAETVDRWLGVGVSAAGVWLGIALCMIAAGIWLVNRHRLDGATPFALPSRAGTIATRSKTVLASFLVTAWGLGSSIVVMSAVLLLRAL